MILELVLKCASNRLQMDIAGIDESDSDSSAGENDQGNSDVEDDEDIPDEDYFELTPENVRDSLMEQWYTSWTVVAQGRPAWKKYGEWGAFWREFLHEPNFKCPSGFTSCNYHPPSVQDIRRMFPNNRVLGRRVLFTSLIYEIMHALTNELDVSVLSPTD